MMIQVRDSCLKVSVQFFSCLVQSQKQGRQGETCGDQVSQSRTKAVHPYSDIHARSQYYFQAPSIYPECDSLRRMLWSLV